MSYPGTRARPAERRGRGDGSGESSSPGAGLDPPCGLGRRAPAQGPGQAVAAEEGAAIPPSVNDHPWVQQAPERRNARRRGGRP
jgi:hypothetical protein